MELMDCPHLAVPVQVMAHVVRVESSFNPFAIGVVGGRLRRQPRNLAEAVATARLLERKGLDFSLGLAQVNRRNLVRQGLANYAQAFEACPNMQAGARILAECHARARGDWGKAFSCYYSGDFRTGFRHGYVQKVFASMRGDGREQGDGAGKVPARVATGRPIPSSPGVAAERAARRIAAGASRWLEPSNEPAVAAAEPEIRNVADRAEEPPSMPVTPSPGHQRAHPPPSSARIPTPAPAVDYAFVF